MDLNRSPALILASALMLVLGTISPALAHGVNIFAWAEGNTVHTESSFSGGKPVSAGKVQVQEHPSGKILLSGTTDREGLFSFPLPSGVKERGSGLKIVLNAGSGHQDTWVLSFEDLVQSDPLPSPSSQPVPLPASSAPPSRSGEGITLSEEELEQILDRKLAPIQRTLSALESRSSRMSEVVGGVGYIVGLLGIALYFTSRRKG